MNDHRAMSNEIKMTKNPNATVPIKALSSFKLLMALITPKPTSGTVIIPDTYPRTQMPPCREYKTTIKNGIKATATKKSSAASF